MARSAASKGKSKSPKTQASTGKPDFSPDLRIVGLVGAEVFLRQEYTRQLEQALEERHGSIDRFAFDGKSVRLADLLDEVRTYGLMQQHKLVILDDADLFFFGKRAGDEDEDAEPIDDDDEDGAGQDFTRNRKAIEAYAENPVEHATLVIRAAKWRASNLDKAIARHGLLVKCEAQGSDTAAKICVQKLAPKHQVTLDIDAAHRLVDLLGPELAHLDTEIAKLASYVGESARITVATVREMVGASREEKAWEIQSALLSGRTDEALRKLHELLDVSRQPEELVRWSIADLLRKLHAAAQLLRQGESEGAIGKRLKLFGSGWEILRKARLLPAARWAELLQLALDADRRAKSGLTEPRRSLECTTVVVTDTIRDQ
jgi:DNA polymerase-3 subunit delta